MKSLVQIMELIRDGAKIQIQAEGFESVLLSTLENCFLI